MSEFVPGTRVKFIGESHPFISVGAIGTVVPSVVDAAPPLRMILLDDLAVDAIDPGDGMPEVICHMVAEQELEVIAVPVAVPQKPVWLHAAMCPRYWEDSSVNDEEDADGTLIPCRSGDTWDLWIDIATGRIDGWPHGIVASIHYKVCDEGTYFICGTDRQVIRRTEHGAYVPDCMSPKEEGYGDYVIMDIGPDGVIAGWRPDLALQVGT